ncbi:MAG: T9SS type A sorting domain-containing protein [Bacteroidales bacterium]|nr:T9SS type A sorting domain-containing protein [Bacteroidales bacterium]
MKTKITILALVLCLPLFLAAQDNQDSSEVNITDSITSPKGYKSFFGGNSTTYSTVFPYNSCFYIEDDVTDYTMYCVWKAKFSVDDTATINNKLYKKIICKMLVIPPDGGSVPKPNTNSVAFVREDTMSGRLYFLDTTVRDEEILVCDMSLNVGDTFMAKRYYNYNYGNTPLFEYKILVADSVYYVDSVKQIHFKLVNDINPYAVYHPLWDIGIYEAENMPFTFTEGIGGCNGPLGLDSYFPRTFDSYLNGMPLSHANLLLCVEKDDTLSYITNPIWGCDPRTDIDGNVKDRKAGSLRVYPNPAAKNINVVIDKPNNNGKIYIVNTIGVVLRKVNMSGDTSTIDVSEFPNGFYTIIFIDEKNRKTAVKFVKQE